MADDSVPVMPGSTADVDVDGDTATGNGGSKIERDKPEPSEARKALLARKTSEIKAAKKKHEDAFKQMIADQDFARGNQWYEQEKNDDRYMINIVIRHISSRVAQLYARNPTVVAKKRKRMDFVIWDETPQSLQQAHMAMQQAQQTGMPPDPEIEAFLADVQQGVAQRRLLDRIGRTLQILFMYQLAEPTPNFKESCKQLVRRVQTCGVGYVKLGYQRLMAKRPATAGQVPDVTLVMDTIERLQDDAQDDEHDDDDAEAEELRLATQALQAQPDVIVREGLVFDFPDATAIIPDVYCKQIKGFVGARCVSEEFMMTVNEIQEVYEIDVSQGFTEYRANGEAMNGWAASPNDSADKGESLCMVWHNYDKTTGLVYKICDGYTDFLEEPAAPDIEISQFWPWWALSFNDLESKKQLFPPSDVFLLRHPQCEYNRTMEARRQHRIASRPLYVSPAGALEDEDNETLANHGAHSVITLNGMKQGDKAEDFLTPLKKAPIDPNFYECETIYQDVGRAVGQSEGALGGPAGDTTATGETIAEGSRVSSLKSNADDLDELLSSVARAAGQVLLHEMDEKTVQEIVGPGATWPKLTRKQIAQELFLEIQAGSSGRPNKAADIANFERMAPILQQTPGINPQWFAKTAVETLDDQIDLTDAVIAGLPSMTAMNANAQPATGGPESDPNQQGPQGAGNAAQPPGTPGGPQPAPPSQAPALAPGVHAGHMQ